MTPKTKSTKVKINRWDYTKQKKVYHSKRIQRMKRQPTKWEKIFANHVLDKGLMFKIYKKIIQLNKKEKQSDFKNGQRN